MAGLVPAIHVLFRMRGTKDVDARHKAGHDGEGKNVDARDIGAKTLRRLARALRRGNPPLVTTASSPGLSR
jgi:hypothetical protein